MSKEILNFQAISANYEVFLFDVVGVIHNGVEAFPYAIEAVNSIPRDKKVIFLSNMPRPGAQTREKLINLGINRPFEVLTSGDVTRELLLTTYAGKKIYHWGAERNSDIDAGLKLNLVENIEESELVLLTAFLREGDDEIPHNDLIDKIIQSNIPVLCANPDKIAMHGGTAIHKCAGSIAEKIIAKGGKVTFLGKPDPFVYEIILEKLPSVDLSKVLMIGDTIETDVVGAKQAGIDSLLVLTGNTGNGLRAANLDLDSYLKVKSWEEQAPTYYSHNLR
jgi:HAD superfamily hydrolase (TIGR01459 family)